MTLVDLPVPALSTVTANGALTAGKHNRVDATSGTRTMTLPTPSASGRLLVEKTDTSANLVTVTGSIRGATTSVSLTWQYETLQFACDAAGTTWYPQTGHKTKTALDAAYAPAGAVASQTFTSANAATQARPTGVTGVVLWIGDATTAGVTPANAAAGDPILRAAS